MRSKTTHSMRRESSPFGRATGKFLLVVDNAPIRRGVFEEARRALRRLSRAKADLRRFSDNDRPAFGRWLSREFREQLADAERLQSELDSLRRVARRIEETRAGRKTSYHRAFQSVMDDFNSGRWSPDETANQQAGPDEEGETFENFGGFDGAEFSGDDGGTQNARSWSMGHGDDGPAAKAAPKSRESLVKETYRRLVRLLHPDLVGDLGAWARELWHQAQEAFSRRDLGDLETLLFVSKVQIGCEDDETPVADMKAGLLHLKRALTDMQPELREAKKDPAWGFSKLKDHTRLARKISYQLEQDIEFLQSQIDHYKVFIEACAAPGRRPRRY